MPFQNKMDWRTIASVVLLVFLLFLTKRVRSTYTNDFVAHIEGGKVVADGLATKYGFLNTGEIDNFADHYSFHHRATQKRSIGPSEGDHTAIKHEPAVKWIEQQVIRKRVKRDKQHKPLEFNDPEYIYQWYLNRKTKLTMNVDKAWEMGYTGLGVVVTILDDGIDYTHDDLKKNYDANASRDINGRDSDPMPVQNYDQSNRHGTRCAGEVAMEANNSICGVGVAPDSGIGGIRMLDGEVTDVIEGESLATQRNYIDIYSASWGPEDNGMTVDGPGRMAKKAFIDGIEQGRDGKGNIFVWASGNGGHSKDSCGCDGYTNSIYTISVSSTSERGNPPWYLEECASTLATTYSSGSSKEGKVVTTDLNNICTSDHTGTSASAPLAAGIIALALQANTNLTWRDVQYIIVMTSRQGNLKPNVDWYTNGAGYKVSQRYGFGLMDAGAMVSLAENWINLPKQHNCTIEAVLQTSDLKGRGLLQNYTIDATHCHNGPDAINYLEHVVANIDVTFGCRGCLVLTLIAPSGTISALLPRRPNDYRKGGFSSWPFMSTHYWGERPGGVWTLQVKNSSPRTYTGRFYSWTLTLHGTDTLPPNRLDASKHYRTRSDSSAVNDAPDDDGANHELGEDFSRGWNYGYQGACHDECFNGCEGPLSIDCYKCKHYRDRESDECVKNCPEVGFYEPQDSHQRCKTCSFKCRSCVGPSEFDCLSCKTGFFLVEKLTQCVPNCPDRFYQDLETNRCSPCAQLCTKCEDSANYCQACDGGAVLTADHRCQLSCGVSEFIDIIDDDDDRGVVCGQCHDSCETCSGGSEDQCLSCPLGYALQDRTCIEEWRCQEGFYLIDGPNSQECLECHISCKSCNGPTLSDCLECRDYYLYQDYMCKANCEDGYYRDPENSYCLLCSPDCEQCINEDSCVACSPEFVLVDGACAHGCDTGWYEHEGHCLQCHDLCKKCTGGGPEDCTLCNEREILYLMEGACVPFCPPGRYNDTESLTCDICDETCLTCEGPEVNDCLTCYEGFKFDDNFCNEIESWRCDPRCLDCLEGSSTDCASCEDGEYLQGKECVSECKDGFYPNDARSECSLCDPTCLTCDEATYLDCLTCRGNQFLHADNSCDSHCPYDTYSDDEEGRCNDCHPSCESCYGPRSDQCDTCEGFTYWNDYRCVSVCPDGMYADELDNECVECFPTCLTCDGPFSTDCLDCHGDFQLDYNTCVSECHEWAYYDENGDCQYCDESCMSCKGGSDTDCLSCDYNEFLNNEGSCEADCPLGYYPSYEDYICRPCHVSCESCIQGGEQDCLDCRQDMFFLSRGDGVHCVDRCPEGFYVVEDGPPGDLSATCQLCSAACLDCYRSYSQCISCRDNTFLLREKCVANCPGGFSEDYSSNQCIAEDRMCPLNCEDCNEWGECEVCDDGFDQYFGECMQLPCDEGQYLAFESDRNGRCSSCTENCLQCLGSRADQCLKCSTEYRLNNGQCDSTCGPHQFLRASLCLACHPSCERCDGSSPYDCRSCQTGMSLTLLGECEVGCQAATYRSNATHCGPCHDSCRTCDGPTNSNCLSCLSESFLTGDQECKDSCPNDTYPYLRLSGFEASFECRQCYSTCTTCTGPSDTECLSCSEDLYLLEHECVRHCGSRYYPEGDICKPCIKGCMSCGGPEMSDCLKCGAGKKLVGSLCLQDCPADYYNTNETIAACEPCHSRCKTCDDMGPFNCLSCQEGYALEDKVCYSRCELGTYYDENKNCSNCSSLCSECYGPGDTHCIDCFDGKVLARLDDKHTTCMSCCTEQEQPGDHNCCKCLKNGRCDLSGNHVKTSKIPSSNPGLRQAPIALLCLIIVGVFALFFGLLQARSRKKLCWGTRYDKLPTYYDNRGEEPRIMLRQNILPSSDEDDFFDDEDGSEE